MRLLICCSHLHSRKHLALDILDIPMAELTRQSTRCTVEAMR